MKRKMYCLALAMMLIGNAAMAQTDDRNITCTPKQEIVVEKKADYNCSDGTKHEEIFKSVEQMPQFPGGDMAMMQYLASHLQYPAMAMENNVQGKVVVQFVIEKDGSVGEVKVVRSVDKDLDKEAVRVCKTLPKFTPGRQDGQPVRVWYTLPINFKLQGVGDEETHHMSPEEQQRIIQKAVDDMVLVKGGSFKMGNTNKKGLDADEYETPAHKVKLNDFYISKYEVTAGLWYAVMGGSARDEVFMQRPIVHVSWNECQDFIQRLNKLTGKNFRLPTEAEWEYAARGGKNSKGYKYAGSNDVEIVACFDGDYSMVGTKHPNELGLYDMSGNVWEWCQDWYGAYQKGTQNNPTGPAMGIERVCRGGSWCRNGVGHGDANDCRVSSRNSADPDERYYDIGFRLVMSAQ